MSQAGMAGKETNIDPALPMMPSGKLMSVQGAILPGAFDQHGRPIICFPARHHGSLMEHFNSQDLAHVVQYFMAITRSSQKKNGFAFLADLTTTGLPAVHLIVETLQLVEIRTPRSVVCFYIVRPDNKAACKQLAKLLGVKTAKKGPQVKGLWDKCTIVGDVGELQNHIDPSQLTSDLGGYLTYDHQTWVQFRKVIEVFSKDTDTVLERVPAVMRQLQALTHCKVDGSIEEAEQTADNVSQQCESILHALQLQAIYDRCKQILQLMRHPGRDQVFAKVAQKPVFLDAQLVVKDCHRQLQAAHQTVEGLRGRVEKRLGWIRELVQYHLVSQQVLDCFSSGGRLHLAEETGIAEDIAQAEMALINFQRTFYSQARDQLNLLDHWVKKVDHILQQSVCESPDIHNHHDWVKTELTTLRLAVEKKHKFYKGVYDFYLQTKKVARWYYKALKFLILVEDKFATGDNYRGKPDLIRDHWEHQAQYFLGRYPSPSQQNLQKVQENVHLIPDMRLRNQGRLLINRCSVLSRLLHSQGGVARMDLAQVLRWKDQFEQGTDDVSLGHTHNPTPSEISSLDLSDATGQRRKDRRETDYYPASGNHSNSRGYGGFPNGTGNHGRRGELHSDGSAPFRNDDNKFGIYGDSDSDPESSVYGRGMHAMDSVPSDNRTFGVYGEESEVDAKNPHNGSMGVPPGNPRNSSVGVPPEDLSGVHGALFGRESRNSFADSGIGAVQGNSESHSSGSPKFASPQSRQVLNNGSKYTTITLDNDDTHDLSVSMYRDMTKGLQPRGTGRNSNGNSSGNSRRDSTGGSRRNSRENRRARQDSHLRQAWPAEGLSSGSFNASNNNSNSSVLSQVEDAVVTLREQQYSHDHQIYQTLSHAYQMIGGNKSKPKGDTSLRTKSQSKARKHGPTETGKGARRKLPTPPQLSAEVDSSHLHPHTRRSRGDAGKNASKPHKSDQREANHSGLPQQQQIWNDFKAVDVKPQNRPQASLHKGPKTRNTRRRREDDLKDDTEPVWREDREQEAGRVEKQRPLGRKRAPSWQDLMTAEEEQDEVQERLRRAEQLLKEEEDVLEQERQIEELLRTSEISSGSEVGSGSGGRSEVNSGDRGQAQTETLPKVGADMPPANEEGNTVSVDRGEPVTGLSPVSTTSSPPTDPEVITTSQQSNVTPNGSPKHYDEETLESLWQGLEKMTPKKSVEESRKEEEIWAHLERLGVTGGTTPGAGETTPDADVTGDVDRLLSLSPVGSSPIDPVTRPRSLSSEEVDSFMKSLVDSTRPTSQPGVRRLDSSIETDNVGMKKSHKGKNGSSESGRTSEKNESLEGSGRYGADSPDVPNMGGTSPQTSQDNQDSVSGLADDDLEDETSHALEKDELLEILGQRSSPGMEKDSLQRVDLVQQDRNKWDPPKIQPRRSKQVESTISGREAIHGGGTARALPSVFPDIPPVQAAVQIVEVGGAAAHLNSN